MATIASLAVQLVANPTKFVAGLKVAENAMHKLGKSGLNPGTWAKLANTGLGKIQGAVNAVVGPIKELVGSIPLIGGALASFPTSVGGFAEWFKQGAERINDMRVTALKLGIGIEKMAGLMLAAGHASEGMAVSMLRLQKELGEAAMKAKGADYTFGRLGLDAKELSRLPLDEVLGKIADKINLLDNQAAKGAAVFSIFGKRGAELMPLLARGSAGIEDFQRKAREMGLAVSAIDAEQVRKATIAMKSLERWIMAAKQSVAIEMSPVVIALAEQFGEVGVNAKAVGEWVKSSAKTMAYGAALVVEAWKKVDFFFDMVKLGFERFVAAMASAIQKLMVLAGQLPDSLGGGFFRNSAQDMSGFVRELRRNVDITRKELHQKWDNDKSAFQSVDDFFEAVDRKTEEAKRKMAKAPEPDHDFTKQFELYERGAKLMEEMASPAEKFAKRMAELNELLEAGAIKFETWQRAAGKAIIEAHKPDEFMLGMETHAEKFANRIDELNQLLNVGVIKWETWQRAAGKAIMESHHPDEFLLGTETALEKFYDRIDELNQLLNVGVIKWETYERAVFNAGKEVMDLHKAESLKMSASAQFGTQEAYSIINRNLLTGGNNRSGIENLKDAIMAQLKIQEKQKKDLDDIAKAARSGFLTVGRI